MQKKAKLRLPELFFVIVCLSVCAGSLFLFWKDLNSTSVRDDKTKIAEIEFKQKIAQRRFSDKVVWERLQTASPLYDADTIRTAEEALATVRFNDGTVIELQGNTMLQIAYSEDKGVNISVSGGNISVDTTASEKIVSLSMNDGSVMKLESGSKASASSNASGASSLQVQSGNASVKSKDGESVSVTEGESVDISDGGKVNKSAISVTSVSKNLKLLSFDEEKVPVTLEWQTSGDFDDSNIVVETSYDKNFSKIEQTFTAKGSDSVTVDSSAGKLYWRVYPEKEKENAAAGRISVTEVQPIVAKAPVDASKYSYRTESNLPQIVFAWEGNDFVSHYLLEVSESTDFKSNVISQKLTETQFVTSSLTSGSYFWRVTPYYKTNGIGYEKSAAVQKFSIVRQNKVLPPSLSSPSDNAKIASYEKNANLSFMWKTSVKPAEYQIQVATDELFNNLIIDESVKTTRYITEYNQTSLPEGKYFWRVSRTSAEDDGVAVSQVRSFNVAKYVPGENKLIYPPQNYSVEKTKSKNIEFVWKLADEYSKKNVTSILQVSPVSDFSRDVVEVRTDGTAARNLDLKAGRNYWRVGVESPSISDEVQFTSYRSVVILNELSAPKITEPLVDQTLTVSSDDSVHFAWNKVSGADYYKIRVSDANTDKLIEEIASTDKNYADIRIPLDASVPKGTKVGIKCTVQAFAAETELSALRIGKISTVNFDLRNPIPLKLLSPVDNFKIDGLAAIRRPVVLNWSSGEKLQSATVTLRKRQADGSYKTVETVPNAKNQVRFERLGSGTYQWYVTAKTGDGKSIQSEEKGSFTISQINELAKASLVTPAADSILTSDFFKNNRSLLFSWDSVPGATDYTFVLYQKKSDGGIKKLYEVKSIRGTEVKLRDLTILDVGDFQWQVIAYSHAKDGFEEQKSRVSSAGFKISFELPGKVKTIDPGKMYGE